MCYDVRWSYLPVPSCPHSLYSIYLVVHLFLPEKNISLYVQIVNLHMTKSLARCRIIAGLLVLISCELSPMPASAMANTVDDVEENHITSHPAITPHR